MCLMLIMGVCSIAFQAILALVSHIVFMICFFAWGMWMWQNMPADCEHQYETDFPDLLFLFHVFVIGVGLTLILGVLFLILVGVVIVHATGSRQLPRDNPVRMFFDPITDAVSTSWGYMPILNDIQPPAGRFADEEVERGDGGEGSRDRHE